MNPSSEREKLRALVESYGFAFHAAIARPASHDAMRAKADGILDTILEQFASLSTQPAWVGWKMAPEQPTDPMRIGCITLDGSTLYIPAKWITDFGIGDDDGETYTLTFKTMTRAEYEALGEFDGF